MNVSGIELLLDDHLHGVQGSIPCTVDAPPECEHVPQLSHHRLAHHLPRRNGRDPRGVRAQQLRGHPPDGLRARAPVTRTIPNIS
eukprot:4403098-Pyramimonas_sp.AAC.1